MVLHGLAYGAENNPELGKFLLVGGLYGRAVHHGIHGHACKLLLFLQGNSQLVECFQQFGVYFVQTLGSVFARSGVIRYVLEIDIANFQFAPVGDFHFQPFAVCFETELQQPLRFVLFCRNTTDYVFIQSPFYHIGFYIGGKTVFIFRRNGFGNYVFFLFFSDIAHFF